MGLEGAVCRWGGRAGTGKVIRIGIKDHFGESAPYESCWTKMEYQSII